jgi:hypothetical protein
MENLKFLKLNNKINFIKKLEEGKNIIDDLLYNNYNMNEEEEMYYYNNSLDILKDIINNINYIKDYNNK